MVNLNSLALVREELDASIARGAAELEAFLLDAGNVAALENCRSDMTQVAGTLRLIQFPGAALLADEMAAALAQVAAAGGAAAEALAGALSHAFFVLPRYIEFVAAGRFSHPLLIIPYVNELRVARRQPLIPEYHFHDATALPLRPRQPFAESSAPGAGAALPRLRQMFQVGLLAILRQQNEAMNLQLVARAAQRFAAQLPASSGEGIWHLAAAVTAALAAGELGLNLNRRRTLGGIERLMARTLKQGAAVPADDELRRELVFLLGLSSRREPVVAAAAEIFAIPALSPSDSELRAAAEAMRGPGLEAIESVVRVLKEELRAAKDILEIASQNQGIDAEELPALRETLNRVADTLRLVNLRAAGNILRQQLALVEGWGSQSGVAPEQFLAVADALLFIESSLSSLYRQELSGGELEQISDSMRKQIIADSQLAEATAIVIGEAQAGIALAKRAITSYVEAGFDPVHITNVATTLDTVRGGMQILNDQRAAHALRGCVRVVEAQGRDGQHSPIQRQQLLETLADALIALEYYLNELAARRVPDGKILNVAEESLAALGHPRAA